MRPDGQMMNHLLASCVDYPAKSSSGKSSWKAKFGGHRPNTMVEKRDKEGTLDTFVLLQPVDRSDLGGAFPLIR